MPKPAHSVFGRNDPERLGHRLDQSFSRARPHFAQNHLDLREGFLYGIQVRRVRWQEHQLRSPRLDQLAHPLGAVGAQLVHHHNLALRKRGRQEMLHVPLKDQSVGRPLDGHRRSFVHRPFERDRGYKRLVLTPVAWHPPVGPLSLGRPRAKASHGSMRPALVHEHQAPSVEARSQPTPQAPHLLVALGGYRRLFFSGHPPPGRRAMARLIVTSETFVAVCSSNARRCSSRVRSGFPLRCSGSHSFSAAPFSGVLPGMGLGSTVPVSRRRFNQRFMEGTDTEKVFATSSLGVPPSTAASTLILRSFEYGFMPRGYHTDQSLCISL